MLNTSFPSPCMGVLPLPSVLPTPRITTPCYYPVLPPPVLALPPLTELRNEAHNCDLESCVPAADVGGDCAPPLLHRGACLIQLCPPFARLCPPFCTVVSLLLLCGCVPPFVTRLCPPSDMRLCFPLLHVMRLHSSFYYTVVSPLLFCGCVPLSVMRFCSLS